MARAVILTLPAIGTIAFSLQSGGFFAGTPAVAAVVVGVLLVLRITLAEEPFAAVSRGLCVAVAALGLYTGLVLASGSWSDSPARAMIEFDRALLYWLVLVLFGSVPWRRSDVAWALRLTVLAIAAVASVALVSRLFPDVFDVTEEVAINRLSYPLTYWNTLGLMCALAIVFCLSLTCSSDEPRWGRVAAATLLPLLAGTLFFTFSRGAIGAAVVGGVAALILAHSRATLGGLIAAGPPVAFTVMSLYGKDLLSGENPKSAAAAAQGHDAALVVGLCMLAAGGLRVLLLLLDRRLERSSAQAFRWLRPAAAALAVAGIVVLVATGVPGRLVDTVDDFVQGKENVTERQDFRSRLTDPGNNGRIDQWNVALEGFRSEPLVGIGAGKFP
ncbi:MAG TPA: hypothetical protein VEQ61_11245, partial [Thermoleophilaceae bacterium]|nr:hypothetical protein [Thermoleophilaceae bacterium]